MTVSKSVTVKQLRDALAALGPAYDDKEVLVWLPGSRIELATTILPALRTEGVLIEGNVRAGSALEAAILNND